MSEFDITRVYQQLNTKYLGRSIVYNHVTKTTMDDAEAGARENGDANGTVYIADRQTGARGSKGSTWKAESTGNLYFTFIIYRDVVKDVDPYKDLNVLSDIDALATLQTLEEFGLQEGRVKWLNDVWVRGHKICGALAEYKGKVVTRSGDEKHLYLHGIGVNINCDMRHDPNLYHIATSTFNETGTRLCREDVFAKLCNRLEPLLEASRQDLRALYAQHALFKTGDVVTVTWIASGQDKVCEFIEVKENGSVNVKDINSGEEYNIWHTDVSVRPTPREAVCVLSDAGVQSWSHDLALKLCHTLVDTSRYTVKSLSRDHSTRGVPSSCKLLVIGNLTSSTLEATLVSALNDYVKQGGNCLCVGNGHRIFKLHTDNVPLNDTVAAQTVRVQMLRDNKDVNMCSLHDSTGTVFADTLDIHSVLAVRTSESLEDKDGIPEVFICGHGAGKLAVCQPNIEVSFSDVQEKFPDLNDKVPDLQSTAYQKDCLFQNILQCLGL